MRLSDGLDLHVSVYGPDDAPLTVLLAHCWTADEEDWHYQVRDLLAHFGHRVRIITWDHRGHGRSGWAPEALCTVPQLARDLGELVDLHAPRGPLVLAGHSIGGMTTMALPEVRPDVVARVAAVAFVSTSSGGMDRVTLGMPETGTAVRAQLPRVLALRARLLSRSSRRRLPSIESRVVHRFLFGLDPQRRDTGLVVDQLTRCSPETMRGYYVDIVEHHHRTAALAAWDDVPCVVLVGDHDLLTPASHARRIAATVRGARLVVAPGAGHMLPLERPALVSTELVALVEGALAAATPAASA